MFEPTAIPLAAIFPPLHPADPAILTRCNVLLVLCGAISIY
jgi:hypothetical protein